MSPIVSALGEPLAFAAVSSVAATLAEWPISLFYLAADMHGWMKRSRIWPNSYASPELIAATVPSVAGRIYSIIIDQTLSFFFPYYVFKFSYGLDLLSEPPSLSFFVIRFILLHIAVDFIFYWMHRAFHESEFLWQVHKQHHQYNVPNALAHFWFSKAELAIQRFFKDWPLMVLFKLHFAEWLAWQVLNQILDVQIHSGYDHGYFWFGGWLGSRVDWHQYHHNQPVKGAYALWIKPFDDLFGTSRNYEGWRERRLAAGTRVTAHDEEVERVMLTDDSGIVGKDGIYGDGRGNAAKKDS